MCEGKRTRERDERNNLLGMVFIDEFKANARGYLVDHLHTFVLPIWNTADPSAWGMTPISAINFRISLGRRPSMRRPSGVIYSMMSVYKDG